MGRIPRLRRHLTAAVTRQPARKGLQSEYDGPFTFTGTLHNVTLDVSGELIPDTEAELRMHLARQ